MRTNVCYIISVRGHSQKHLQNMKDRPSNTAGWPFFVFGKVIVNDLGSMKSDDAEKIYANDKVAAQRIREENEKRILEGYSKERREQKSSSAQMDGGSRRISSFRPNGRRLKKRK